MDINIPENVKRVLTRLVYGGFDAFIVGGCVRDSLLGLTPKDYDITTNARPDEVIALFDGKLRVIKTGIKHGTVTVVSGGENVEVTTYRTDGDYSDHRHPDSVAFASRLEDDLSRRDFTVNAMAYSAEKGIIDPYGGQHDLFRQRISCVGSPDDRFEEDALRIMRGLRFASRFGFRIDAETAAAMHRKKSLLRDISAERIRDELTGFVTGRRPCDLMLEFDDIFGVIIPETVRCVGFEQHSRYHVYDVWEHTARALENSRQDKDIRLALFFHDIEKPSCFKTDEEGHGHFPGHEVKSAETAGRIMRELKFDNETIARVTELIKYHYITPIDDKRVVKRLISVMGAEQFCRLTEVMKGDSRAKQDFCLERVNLLDTMKKRCYEIIADNECCTLAGLAVKGDDLTAIGFNGRSVGEMLNKLLKLVIEEKLPNDKDTLLAYSRKQAQPALGRDCTY